MRSTPHAFDFFHLHTEIVGGEEVQTWFPVGSARGLFAVTSSDKIGQWGVGVLVEASIRIPHSATFSLEGSPYSLARGDQIDFVNAPAGQEHALGPWEVAMFRWNPNHLRILVESVFEGQEHD